MIFFFFWSEGQVIFRSMTLQWNFLSFFKIFGSVFFFLFGFSYLMWSVRLCLVVIKFFFFSFLGRWSFLTVLGFSWPVDRALFVAALAEPNSDFQSDPELTKTPSKDTNVIAWTERQKKNQGVGPVITSKVNWGCAAFKWCTNLQF